jgi:hypothetical protein
MMLPGADIGSGVWQSVQLAPAWMLLLNQDELTV